MDISELNLGDLMKLMQALGGSQTSLRVGEKYFVRTVTYHYVGRLVSVSPTEIVLEEASWVADSGRWHEALTTGKLSEVEPYPGQVIINHAAMVDATPWTHELPREVL